MIYSFTFLTGVYAVMSQDKFIKCFATLSGNFILNSPPSWLVAIMSRTVLGTTTRSPSGPVTF